MVKNMHRNPLMFGPGIPANLVPLEATANEARTDHQEIPENQQDSYWKRFAHSIARASTWMVSLLPGLGRASEEQSRPTGGKRMIFRRENRGESFQRQVSNLRQQPQEAPAEGEEQEYDRDYESEEPTDTSRFSTDQGTPAEGISFPSSRSEVQEASAAAEAPPAQPAAQPAAPAAPATQAYPETTRWQAGGDTSSSIIAANSAWNGTLTSEGSLRVHGKADGELYSATDLFVAEGAEVDASLFADSVVVAGLVRGKIEARSRLEILPQGEVTGDVRAPKLVVHEGATISGQLKMEDVQTQPTYSRESAPGRGNNSS